MTWTSRAARRPFDQLGRRTSAGRALDSAIRPWSFNGGAQSGRLSGLEDHVSNRVVTTDTVAVAPAAHLVVTEGVSNTATLGGGKLCSGTPSLACACVHAIKLHVCKLHTLGAHQTDLSVICMYATHVQVAHM